MDPVLVLGSGMSGAAVAAQLCRHDIPTLVVELGPIGVPQHVAASAETLRWLEPADDPHFRPFRDGAPKAHYGEGAGARVRLGGRSLYWRGIVLRIEDYGLADWPVAVRDALLGLNTGRPGYYSAVERQLEAWVGGGLDAERSATESDLVRRIRGLGFSSARPTARAARHLGAGLWAAYSPLSEAPTPTVLGGRTLVDLTPRARGGADVRLRGPNGPEHLRVAAAVLCAGAIENARLVEQLTKTARIFSLVDHHTQGWVCVKPSTWAVGPDEASVLVSREADARVNRFVEVHRVRGQTVLDAWAMGEQLPTKATRLSFDGPSGSAHVEVEFTAADEDVLTRERALLAELSDALGIRVRAGGIGLDADRFDAALARANSEPGVAMPYYCPLGTTDHESCTLPLGGDVVCLNGELRSLPGVFVAGPCLFPRPGAANPSLTTLALSRYVADHIHRHLR